jgi:hypothetical protein
VWIAYLRGDSLIEVELLTAALEHGESIWLAPPILQEVLQGADGSARLHHDRDFNLIANVEPKLTLVVAQN